MSGDYWCDECGWGAHPDVDCSLRRLQLDRPKSNGHIDLASLAAEMLGPITDELERVSSALGDSRPESSAVTAPDTADMVRLLNAVSNLLQSGVASRYPRVPCGAAAADTESRDLIDRACGTFSCTLQAIDEVYLRAERGSPPEGLSVGYLAEVVRGLREVQFGLVAAMALPDGSQIR